MVEENKDTNKESVDSTKGVDKIEETTVKVEETTAEVTEKVEEKIEEEKEEAKKEPKAEVVEEVKEEAKEEPKAEVVEEVKEEAKEEPKAEVVEEVKEEAKEEPKAEVVEEVKEETKEEPKAEVVEEVKEETKEEPKAEVVEEAKEEPKAEVVEIKKSAHENVPLEDFDWDVFVSDEDNYSTEERADLEGTYGDTLSTVQENQVLDGVVTLLTKREVVINIGYKSEGIITISEFRYNPDLKVGDSVEIFVENQEDKNGQLVLSHKKARALRSWERVNESLENNEVIKGLIKCRTKGGMIVDVFGIEAFLPGSQIDVKPIRDYDIYVGKTMELKVVKINKEFRNVVVSHKALIEAELEQQKAEIISKLEKGQVLEGTAKNITSYGVFVDLGGVDGLIHITDLSWGRVSHPEEIVQLDEKLNVVILDFDDTKKRIALGLKQLTKHPWDSLDTEMKVGDKVNGKVVVMADYGAFVEIASGVEGLIHVSEMSWSQHLRSAQEFLKVGDEVEAQILTLDRDDRKMSLGIKQLKPDPWAKIDDKYQVNSKHTAKVRNFTGFGIFVEIEEGVDGLIHISDLSWTKKIKHPAEFTSIGEEIEVVVLDIDKENRRLSLGHKQLEENPWDVFETVFNVDSVHEGTVIELFDKGAIISLPYGVEGFATPRHLVREDKVPVKVDDKLEFKVIEFSKGNKKIILSHSRTYEDVKRSEDKKQKTKEKSARKDVKSLNDKSERTTLGDISSLAALKMEMEEDAKKKLDEMSKKKKS